MIYRWFGGRLVQMKWENPNPRVRKTKKLIRENDRRAKRQVERESRRRNRA